MIEEILKALERLPLWKRISAMPSEVEALQARVTALEARLAGTTGPLCPVCNAPGFTKTGSRPDPIMGVMGVMQDSFQCPACNHKEDRQRDTFQP
jgi:hypothetical protein